MGAARQAERIAEQVTSGGSIAGFSGIHPNTRRLARAAALQAARLALGLNGRSFNPLLDPTPEAVDDRTPVEKFADLAAAQFDSELEYDGAEVRRRIEMTAHIISPEHPPRAADCPVCRDDDRLDGGA